MDDLSELLASLFWSDTLVNYRQLQRVCIMTMSQKTISSEMHFTITTNALRKEAFDHRFLQELSSSPTKPVMVYKGSWVVVKGVLPPNLSKDTILEGFLGFCVLRPVVVWKLVIVDPPAWKQLALVDLLGVIENKIANGDLLEPDEIQIAISNSSGLFWESKSVFASPPDHKELVDTICNEFNLDTQAVAHVDTAGPGWAGFGFIGFGPNVPKGSIGFMMMMGGRPICFPHPMAEYYQASVCEILLKRKITAQGTNKDSFFPTIYLPLAKEHIGSLMIVSIEINNYEELTLYSIENAIPKIIQELISCKIPPKYSKLLWTDAAHKLQTHQGREFKKIAELVAGIERLLTPSESTLSKPYLPTDEQLLDPEAQKDAFILALTESLTNQYCNM